jgi:hypothetical protein
VNNKKEQIYDSGGISGWMIDAVLDRFMDKYGITQVEIDKVKNILSTIKIEEENGNKVIKIILSK